MRWEEFEDEITHFNTWLNTAEDSVKADQPRKATAEQKLQQLHEAQVRNSM